jgi:hypothetical protein
LTRRGESGPAAANLFDTPFVVGHAGGDGWRRLQRHVDPRENVGHEVQGHGSVEVFQLLAERIGQAREPAHAHPHGEVLPLHVARADLVRVGIAGDDPCLGPDALGRAVAAFLGRVRAVLLDEDGVVNVAAEGALYRFQVGLVAVCSELDPMAEAAAQVVDESCRVGPVPLSDQPGRH